MNEPIYVLGHARAELDRLRTQGAFFEDITRRAFEAAGLAPGSRVLDIGCGAGDVSRLVAARVGPDGSVVAIDRVPEAIAFAREVTSHRRITNIDFRLASIDELSEPRPFDALVGRFVLMHQADPAATLRAAARHVRPGGLIVMIESAMSACGAGFHSFPHSPIYDRLVRTMIDIIRAAGADSEMGFRLSEVFDRAGLPRPTMWLQARVEAGPEAAIFRYMADSLRSMLPSADRLGVDRGAMLDIDEIEEQWRAEVTASNGTLVSPPLIAAWTRIGLTS